MAAPIKAAARGKQAAGVEIGKASVAPVPAPVQKVAASAFNQLVSQIVAESADPETSIPAAPIPAALVKAPPKSTPIPTDQSSEMPVPVRTAPAPLIEPSTSARRTDTRSTAASSPSHAQSPSVPVDVNTLIPIALKPQLPFSVGSSPEPKPVNTAPAASTEENAPIAVEPKPILEVKIRLDQETSPAVQPPVAVAGPASATRGAQDEAAPTVPQLRLDAAPAPVAALPAPPPAPAPIAARGAASEPQTTSAPLREESPNRCDKDATAVAFSGA